MHVDSLICVSCGERYSPETIVYRCGECGASLDVSYDYAAISDLEWEDLQGREFSHGRYREFLPVVEQDSLVQMGEGGTPVVSAQTLGEEIGAELVFKLESMNPTGSFKDRGTTVELGKALDHQADDVVVASTGNMGASIAAYTARAGIDARIYIPDGTGGPKARQMEAHGAEIVRVDGGYDLAAEKAWHDWEDDGIYLLGDYPYRGEGEKTLGFEIAEQTDPDVIVLPVGNGTLIHAVWKAFVELKETGLIDETPKMVGVQAEGCNTVVNALQKGFETVRDVDRADTVAGAIACADPLDGDQALEAIQESGGFGIAVSDTAILEAKQRLAGTEGIYAEEAAAAAIAGLIRESERFGPDQNVVVPICGHGLKTATG